MIIFRGAGDDKLFGLEEWIQPLLAVRPLRDLVPRRNTLR